MLRCRVQPWRNEMTTHRLNLVLKEETNDFLNALAQQDSKQAGTLAREILENALEEMENKLWFELAINRQKESALLGERNIMWEDAQEMFKDKK